MWRAVEFLQQRITVSQELPAAERLPSDACPPPTSPAAQPEAATSGGHRRSATNAATHANAVACLHPEGLEALQEATDHSNPVDNAPWRLDGPSLAVAAQRVALALRRRGWAVIESVMLGRQVILARNGQAAEQALQRYPGRPVLLRCEWPALLACESPDEVQLFFAAKQHLGGLWLMPREETTSPAGEMGPEKDSRGGP